MSEAEKVVPAEEQVEEKPVVVAEAEKKVEEEREEPDSDNNMDANKESEKKKKKKKKSKKKVTGRVFVRLLIPRFHQADAALPRRIRGLVCEVRPDCRLGDSCSCSVPASWLVGFHFRQVLSSG